MAGAPVLTPAFAQPVRRPAMRIAFYAPRASFLGQGVVGEASHIRSLCSALRRRGHAVEVASDLNVRSLWRGHLPPWKIATEALAIRRRMKRFRPDAWLVFGANGTYPDLFGWWQRGTPYVLVAVDPWTSPRMPLLWRWPLSIAFDFSLKRARRVGAYRPRCRAQLRARGVADEKLELFLPAVDVPASVPSRSQARGELGLPHDVPVVLCISRLPEGKEQHKTDAVVELVSMTGDLPAGAILVVVGDGAGRERVLRAADELPDRGRVRLVGHVPDTKPYYAACDVFAYPIAMDRPWVSVLEAQALGRPVVVMRTTSAEVTVDDGRTGLLVDDPAAFRAQLAALAGDRARCHAMGTSAHAYIAASHSAERQAADLERWLADS